MAGRTIVPASRRLRAWRRPQKTPPVCREGVGIHAVVRQMGEGSGVGGEDGRRQKISILYRL